MNIDGSFAYTFNEFAFAVKDEVKKLLQLNTSLDDELLDFQISVPIVMISLSVIQIIINVFFWLKLRKINCKTTVTTTTERQPRRTPGIIDIENGEDLEQLETLINNIKRKFKGDIKYINVKLEIIHGYLSDQAEFNNIL